MSKSSLQARKRTAIYARVSTLDQDPGMQLRELRAYAKARALPVVDEFIDQITGTIRPSSTVAAIPPNRLYLIGNKELLASSQPFVISQPNFPCPPEPALFRDY